MTRLVQVAVANDVAEAELIQSMLRTAGIESHLEPAVEHDAGAHDDLPLKVLVAESEIDEARDAIEALAEPDEDAFTL
ncbi:MAG: DUF2007 domain-containing protein [Thermoleophilia bacterium]|nr:DUF2007 domain-containing protein [Gaiellaceae bacterium]MDW8338053.1 DUF2007 domain-containing protein [Thermoleophilia bacterium]